MTTRQLPQVNCARGAPMSRRGNHSEPDLTARFHLVRLDWVDGDLPGEIRPLGSSDVEEAPGEPGA